MDSYIKNQLKRKVSSFILSEAGKVGNRNTFSAAALVTASSIAALILAPQKALAANCGPEKTCAAGDYCCLITVDPQQYACLGTPDPNAVSCWLI